MTFNHRHLALLSFIFATAYSASSTSSFCDDPTSKGNTKTPCFLEPKTFNPALIRSSSNSLILPCHVARSKHSTVEWWYTDLANSINIKIYPVFPVVRPTVLRFITAGAPVSKHANETDIVDASILLRFVNVDDSGTYRCVIRSWSANNLDNVDDESIIDDPNTPALSYHVELTAPRLCQSSPGTLPCFSSMRTSSPTVVDAYQTAFLQCVIQNYNRPTSVFWVVGNASVNSVLITEYLATNQHNGDRLRRVFPLSVLDYSIEVTVNRDTPERSYSCVIDGATNGETTIFTYIVRALTLNDIAEKKPIAARKNVTLTTTTAPSSNEETSTTTSAEIVAHDTMSPKQIDALRRKVLKAKPATKEDDESDDLDDLYNYERREQAATPSSDA